MRFIDKYYAILNNSVGQHSVTISRAEFANLLGVFSKQEQQLDQLKDKNERLKNELSTYGATGICEVCIDKSVLQNDKYTKALIEIKEIVKNMNNECFYDDFECKDCDMKNGCTYSNKSKILQIIKEMK